MGLLKKRDSAQDLSIVDDVKEPFSWRVFWDEKVIGKFKAMKKFLEEKGILFFLLSPFQYRNRLITKLVVIVLGVSLGVVPRAMTLVQEARERNAQSELSAIADKVFSAGAIQVKPLGSGQYERQHLMVFAINGQTSEGVGSTDSDFIVRLESARGVSDVQNVKYRYHILPVSVSQRLLMVWVDNTRQNDKTGIYNLFVSMKNGKTMQTPMEVVLSDGQEETPIFGGGKIDLSSLATKLNTSSGRTIADAVEKLDASLETLKINEERLLASGFELDTVSTVQYIRDSLPQNMIFATVTDSTTTRQAVALPFESMTSTPSFEIKFRYMGVDYSAQSFSNSESEPMTNPEFDKAKEEFDILRRDFDKVSSLISALNSARMSRYNSLIALSNTLNEELHLGDMTDAGQVKEGGKK